MGGSEKKTILIVEDEPQNRKLFRDVLEFHGYATIEAADGRKGIEMANQLAPDLILMDMGLPGMNGIEATRVLIGAEATRRIPIVAITAFAMPGDREKILEAGCRDYIAKPIHIPDLLNKVAEYLGSEPSPVAEGEDHERKIENPGGGRREKQPASHGSHAVAVGLRDSDGPRRPGGD